MTNWKSEYLAMKLKYVNAKQKAGARKKQAPRIPINTSVKPHPIYWDNSAEDFKNRLNGTPLENNIEVIYNLYLVKKNIRKAFLLELSQEDFREIKNVDIIIKQSYPEFEYTIETLLQEKAHRIFIHNPELSQEDLPRENGLIKVNDDILVATLLDFDCKGIPDNSNISYTLHIKINGKGVIASICDHQDKFNMEKLTNYEKAAEELGYSFSYNINRNMPDVYIIDKLIAYIQTNNKSHLQELSDSDILNLFENAFLRVLVEEEIGLNEEIVNFDFIDKNKYLITFILLMEKFEVFHYLYPLTNEQVEIIDSMLMDYKSDYAFLNKNAQGFLDFINGFDEIFIQETIDTGLLDYDIDEFLDGWFYATGEFVGILDTL